MMKNIEIKAILRDSEGVKVKANELSGGNPVLMKQVDTFYNVTHGRLKLRVLSDNNAAELIHYERPDIPGPKLSHYTKITFNDKSNYEAIDKILSDANGRIGLVEKTRYLYIVGQSRIHVDLVTNLGSFMEIEVVLRDNQDVKEGEEISNNLMEKLGIAQDDLVSEAYIDLLLKQKTTF